MKFRQLFVFKYDGLTAPIGGCNILFPGGDVQYYQRKDYQPGWKLNIFNIKLNMSDASPHS